MARDCAVDAVEGVGEDGCWARWAAAAAGGGAEVEVEDRRIADTKLSRASSP